MCGFSSDLAYPGAEFGRLVRDAVQRREYGPGDPKKQILERVKRARRLERHHYERTRSLQLNQERLMLIAEKCPQASPMSTATC